MSATTEQVCLTAHPRAVAGIRRARGACGLLGFLAAAYLAHRAGLPGFDVLVRALAGGIAAHLAGWAFAIVYWRSVVLAEIEHARAGREAARSAADRVLRQSAADNG